MMLIVDERWWWYMMMIYFMMIDDDGVDDNNRCCYIIWYMIDNDDRWRLWCDCYDGCELLWWWCMGYLLIDISMYSLSVTIAILITAYND